MPGIPGKDRRGGTSIKNICFIEVKSPGAHIYSRTSLPRLGTILLATLLKAKGYDTKVFIEDIAEPDWEALSNADLIGISSITSTAPRAFQLAERFRSMGIPVVLGGPHPTFLPEESLAYADYVVRGEGEETIVELIEHLEGGTSLEGIPGLSFRKGDTVIHNPDRPLVQDLDAGPIPNFNLVHNWKKRAYIPIATSRGCPFGCRFCSVIPMFGRGYRFKSVDRVITELREAASRDAHIFFIDDNFAANRERTKVLLRRIIAEGLRIEWSAQVRTDAARDPELIDLMARSGCFMVFVGFESINPHTLSLFQKKQDVDDIVTSVEAFKSAAISIHGMFVLGADTDDIGTIRSTKKFAKRIGINSIQFMMLTPLPGTPVFEEFKEQGRLIHTEWDKYDAHHAVFKPKLMTSFELQTETLRAMAGFYSFGAILKNLLRGDLFYSLVGLYGKRSLKKARALSRNYCRKLRDGIRENFDRRAGRLKEYVSKKRKEVPGFVLHRITEDGIESVFFKTFFKKIGQQFVISHDGLNPPAQTLTIMPVLHTTGSGESPDKKTFFEICEKYKAGFGHLHIIPLETTSLYRACVDLGLLLGVRMKKIRKAYEKAAEELNGRVFNCSAILVIARQDLPG